VIRHTRIPHSIRLTLTDRCNLSCDFCFMDASSQSNKEELKTDEWLQVFKRLKELRVFNISLSGGEIFLRDDLMVLLKQLRENRMHKITLLTNGTLITKEIAGQLEQLKIKSIIISLDGLEEKHDQIRGSGAFRDTVTGIRHLISAGITPYIAFTPVRDNYSDLGALIDFLVPLGVSGISVNTLTPEGRCLEIYKDVVLQFPQQVKDVLTVVADKKRLYPDFKIDCSLGFHYNLPQSYHYYKENPGNYEIKHLKDGCGAASTSCAIAADGAVIPCEGLSMFKGGNIKEQDLSEIWNDSENFKTIRNLSNVSMDQTPHCKECKYIYLCDGGCRATAKLIYNDLTAPDISCPYWDGAQTGLTP